MVSLCKEERCLENVHADHKTSVDGENDSMIDKAGNEYVKQNGVFMKTQAASRTQRPTPGDEEDEGYEEGDLTNSVGGRRGTRRQQLTHQTGTGGSLQDEPSSGNDEDGARTNPNISIDSLETHKHMGSFDGENQSLSPAVTNNEPMAKSNLLASIPPNANVLDDVIAAVEIQRDLDDREHPGSLNDKEQALRESRKTAAAEKIKQEKQARQFTGTRSCGFDQLPSMPALGYVESMSPSSGSTLQLNRHSVSEGPARGQGCFSSPANAGSKKQHDVRRPSSSISPGLLSSRRRSSATRDTFGSATFHPPGHRAAILPEERWSQRDKVIFQRGFEKGRRYGRTEQRNAAKVLIQAQAQGGGMDDDEMDEEDG